MRWILVLMGIVGIVLQLPTSAPAADGPLAPHRIGNRTYQLFVPPGPDRRPLVIALHGGGGRLHRVRDLRDLFTLDGEPEAPPPAVDQLSPCLRLQARDPARDRGVFDADQPRRARKRSRLRQRREMPKILPVRHCAFSPR